MRMDVSNTISQKQGKQTMNGAQRTISAIRIQLNDASAELVPGQKYGTQACQIYDP